MVECVLLLAAFQAQTTVESWVSSQDMSRVLAAQEAVSLAQLAASTKPDIFIDPETTFQSILGLGASLEHSTCYNISKLAPAEQESVVERIAHPEKGIGMNLMRICIGTPDFTASPWYTYDDLPKGETDPDLEYFSIDKDREYVLPVLKMALRKNPELLFIAAPWSPPGWMTSNDKIGGGRIKTEHFDALGRYLAKFVKAYEAEGIPIYALTPQNEPDYAPSTYPTCRWRGEEQRDFIRDYLGPEFQRQDIKTQIWCWDHNFNLLDFPRAILRDPKAAQYANGTAFHFYEGEPEDMAVLRAEFPDKDIFFTEGSTFGVRGASMIIRILRNWARSYNAWVTIIDDKRQPNPGPHDCSLTCIVLNTADLSLEYRFDYYMYGQFMKFIKRGAVRVGSSECEESFANVAFKNPDGSMVLIVANTARAPRTFAAACGNVSFSATLDAVSVGTYVWKP